MIRNSTNAWGRVSRFPDRVVAAVCRRIVGRQRVMPQVRRSAPQPEVSPVSTR